MQFIVYGNNNMIAMSELFRRPFWQMRRSPCSLYSTHIHVRTSIHLMQTYTNTKRDLM